MVSEIINAMISYFGTDIRRINHALKVYGFTKGIMGSEVLTEDMMLTVELAAVLHDIGIKAAESKYHSSEARYQELEGPPVAEKILLRSGVDKKITDRVCFLIGHHHSYGRIDGMDFQILVEADFIVNIFEGNMEEGAVKSIRDKYFRTAAGKAVLESMYHID